MKRKHLKIMKKLYNNFLNPPLAGEFYNNPKELKIIRELLSKFMLNPNRYKISPPMISPEEEIKINKMFDISGDVKSSEIVPISEHEKKYYVGEYIEISTLRNKTPESDKPVFTTEGKKYYFNHVNKNWYKRLKEKWGIELLIDVFAIVGFITGIILGYIKISEYNDNKMQKEMNVLKSQDAREQLPKKQH